MQSSVVKGVPTTAVPTAASAGSMATFFTALQEKKLSMIPADYRLVINTDSGETIGKSELAQHQIESALAWKQKALAKWAMSTYPAEWTAFQKSKEKSTWEKIRPLVFTMGGPLLVFGAGAAFLPAVAAEGVTGTGSLFVGEGALATGAETGVEFAAYDAAIAEGAAAGVGTVGPGSVAVESVFGAGEFAAYDAAIAEGAAAGVGSTAGTTIPGAIATGAGTIVSTVKGASDVLGIGAAVKSIFSTVGGLVAKDHLTSFVNDMFGGSTGEPGAGGAGGAGSGGFGTEGGSGKFNYLPYLLIGLTLLGAFLLSRKQRG